MEMKQFMAARAVQNQTEAYEHTQVTPQDVQSILISALEGNGYWCGAEYKLPENREGESEAIHHALGFEGQLTATAVMAAQGDAYMELFDVEMGAQETIGFVNRSALIHAIEHEAASRGLTVAKFMDVEACDAMVADVVFQHAAFGKVVYG